MFRRSVTILCSIGLLLYSVNAFAVVMSWDYTTSSVFESSTFSNGSGEAPTISDTYLEWGFASDVRSSLEISPDTTSDTVSTYIGGGAVPTSYWADDIAITHNNVPISASSQSLLTTVIASTVTLTPNPFLPNDFFEFDVRVSFFETPNDGNDENDVFALLDGFPNSNFFL